MKVNREKLEDQLESYEEELKGLSSYFKELQTTANKHGTDRAHFEGDLVEAEHNIKFYEAEIARIKGELGAPGNTGRPPTGEAPVPPRIPKPGISSIIFSSIGFVVGALFGSRFKSRNDK